MTNLYIKQHKDTGMLYFGKTIRNDPKKYKGSGTFWMRHIKKHSNNVDTIWVEKFTDTNDLVEFATFFSDFFDIVKSPKWANLMGENGMDGGSSNLSDETREKMRKAALARTDRFDINSIERKPHTKEACMKISKSLTGLKKSSEHKANMWKTRGGRHSEETRQKMREGHARRAALRKGTL